MSIASFRTRSSSDRAHTTADELESFFNVILHLAIRFCPHDMYAPDCIDGIFVDPVAVYGGDTIYCPASRCVMIARSGELKYMSTNSCSGRSNNPTSHSTVCSG